MLKLLLVSFASVFAFASGGEGMVHPDITMTWVGFSALAIFVVGYYFIATEEKYHIDKAKPALLIGIFMMMLFLFLICCYDIYRNINSYECIRKVKI